MKKYIILVILIFKIINITASQTEKLSESFFKYADKWEKYDISKKETYKCSFDDYDFKFTLPLDMKKSKIKSKDSEDIIQCESSFSAGQNNHFYIIKMNTSRKINKEDAIKDDAQTRFYNTYCNDFTRPYSNIFIVEKGYMNNIPYYIYMDNSYRRRCGKYIRDTIRTYLAKVFITDKCSYLFSYDTDDHIYEVPLEEKLAVMKSIRIISKEEAKAEEEKEKNTAGNIKFLISMLALLFLVFIGSKLNNRR